MKNNTKKLEMECLFLHYKTELNQLKEENLRLQQLVSERIDKAKSEITESAINKTMSILGNIQKWILALNILVGAVVYFTHSSFMDGLKAFYKDEVNNWLRLNNDNSGAKQVLDDFRTRAILDSYSIRLAREKSWGSHVFIKLNPMEVERMMAIILDPNSSDPDFIDALNLITTSHRVLGHFSLEDNASLKLIANIVADSRYSDRKRGIIFDKLRGYRTLVPYSISILDNKDISYSEEMLMATFENVRHFDKERALNFAEKYIDELKYHRYKVILAKFLSDINAINVEDKIDKLTSDLKIQKEDTFLSSHYMELITYKLNNWSSKKNYEDRLAIFISNQIDEGLNIAINDIYQSKAELAYVKDGTYFSIKNVTNLFGNIGLINKIIKQKSIDHERLLVMTNFFQVKTINNFLTTLVMEPNNELSILFQDNSFFDASDCLSDIWLRVDTFAGDKKLMAIWRDKLSIIHEKQIKSLEYTNNANFYIEFDANQLRSYSSPITFEYPDRL